MESIAHFRITDKIGEGGMGKVYRAIDTRLKRTVAIKVLPDIFARDRDRMARFRREAQMLASLNHPNIASIHGLEEFKGKQALVMELVEGKTLAERLRRGPIPLEEALSLARQIAEALEEAHERGIIHRDLKPANVKLTSDGSVKLLDFGLAKALEGERGASPSPELSQSPTLSGAATAAGMILGTAGYMSPEQARGQKVDRRSDIWSFGIVVYEMLSGKQVFTGDTLSDVLASVLKSDPDWDKLSGDTPAAVRQLLRRCLVRDPKQRLQSIGDARIAIDEYRSEPTPVEATREVTPAAAAPLWRRALPWTIFALASILVMTLAFGRRPGAAEPPLRLNVQIAEQPLFLGLSASAVLSPDGTRIATVVGDAGANTELTVLSLDQSDGRRIDFGTKADTPYNPFFSPDGRWLGYVTPDALFKVPVSGGTPLKLCALEKSRGASWGADDIIVFAPSPNSPLFRVSAAGGEPEPLSTLDEAKGETTHRWPQVLPGGKAVLFTSHTQAAGGFDKANIEVLVLETGERKVVHRGGSFARYVPSGHLVYANGGALFAMPFDIDNLEATGSPAPVVQEVSWSIASGGAQFSFSDTGRLIYVREENKLPEYPVIWVDLEGTTAPLWEERGSYANPRLSPDGKRLSLTVLRDGNWDIWVYDLERGVPTRLTFDEATDTEQVWSPDGEALIFSSDRDGVDNLYRKRADGSGGVERLTESAQPQWATSWSSDGRFVALLSAENKGDLWVLPREAGEAKPELFLSTPFVEADSSFSPDGRWLAYDSDESGRPEVYVRPFPPRGGKWQLSDGGAAYPRWSRDGRQLFYRTDEGIMVVAVDTSGESFRAGKPRPLLEGSFRGGSGGLTFPGMFFADYDVAGDGKRFVMFPEAEDRDGKEHAHVTLVTHWFDELQGIFDSRMN